MKLNLHRLFPALGLTLAAGLFVFGSALQPSEVNAGGKACLSKKFETKAVAEACKDNQKAAKKLMKGVVKKSRDLGDEKTCLDCHKDLKKFGRTKDAVKDLKVILKKMGKS